MANYEAVFQNLPSFISHGFPWNNLRPLEISIPYQNNSSSFEWLLLHPPTSIKITTCIEKKSIHTTYIHTTYNRSGLPQLFLKISQSSQDNACSGVFFTEHLLTTAPETRSFHYKEWFSLKVMAFTKRNGFH